MLPQQWWITCNAKASCYHNNDELDAILKHHITIIWWIRCNTNASCYHNNDELDAILKHHDELDAILKHHVTIIMMN